MSAIDDATMADLAELDPTNPMYEAQVLTAMEAYWEAKQTAGELPAPVAPTGTPHFVRDGVRMTAQLLIVALKLYARHKPTVDPYLSGPLLTALTTLLALLPVIEDLNKQGPV